MFNDKPNGSKTYKVKTKQNLFTGKPNELLFYQGDINHTKRNNDSLKVVSLNKTLNYLATKLGRKGVQLIVLPSPDKYDIYYDYIIQYNKYPRPLFFHYYDNLPKLYLYVNSKKIITDLLRETKDVYYYDGTHWSPTVADKIAQEIVEIIN